MIRYALPLLLLAGCQSGQSDYQMAENSCLASGATAATLTSCTTAFQAQRQYDRERRNAGMLQLSAALLAQNRPPATQPMSRQVQCYSKPNGYGAVITTCR